jgi:hypothetical protein
MQRIRSHFTYANVISTICLFLVLGGATAFAAGQLGKNTVGSKQLKKGAVTAAKIKKETITATQVKNDSLTGAQINESTLGTVPSATSAGTASSAKTANSAESANSAAVASSLTAAEAVHVVGAAGQPGFENGATNLAIGLPISLPSVGFWKDKEGVVHLTGYAKIPTGSTLPSIFTLPPGFRPAAGQLTIFTGALSTTESSGLLIGGTGASLEAFELSGKVVSLGKEVILEGISFRAGS